MMPGMGQFLFQPMAMAVAFSMAFASLLSWSFVPSRCASWLKSHGVAQPISGHGPNGEDHEHRSAHEHPPLKGRLSGWFERWENVIDRGIQRYLQLLNLVMRRRLTTVFAAIAILLAVLALLGTRLRREFFPEVDAGAFEIYVRDTTGTRIEVTEEQIAKVEKFVRETVGEGPAIDHQRNRRDGRLVRRLHAELRSDGRRGQGSTRSRTHALRSGVRASCCATGLAAIRNSRPWNSRSTPAA